MSGFDNGTEQGGIFAQAKQFGAVLRGTGDPVPAAGVVGDLYLDTQTYFLYEKRDVQGASPWAEYLFAIPATYRDGLKWFSSELPTNDFGANGDYCLLWGGYNNYGLQPSFCGPKAAGCWPESGSGPDLLLDAAYVGYSLPAGLSDEGTPIAFSNSWQLVVAGLGTEYILAIPVPQTASTPSNEEGLQAAPVAVAVMLNPTYAATDKHAV